MSDSSSSSGLQEQTVSLEEVEDRLAVILRRHNMQNEHWWLVRDIADELQKLDPNFNHSLFMLAVEGL